MTPEPVARSCKLRLKASHARVTYRRLAFELHSLDYLELF